MKVFSIVVIALLTPGCAHYLYQGDFEARNNLDETSQFRIWWSKTAPLIGQDKAGPIILDVKCGAPITFTESRRGIVFIGGADQYESVTGEAGPSLVCGKITSINRFLDYSGGELTLSSTCKPRADDEGFSAVQSILLSTEQAQYHIPISEMKQWSLNDSALSAAPLECS